MHRPCGSSGALAGVLERGRSIQDVDHLERAVMDVPLLHLILGLVAVVTNEVST